MSTLTDSRIVPSSTKPLSMMPDLSNSGRTNTQRVFDRVTQNLLSLGSCRLENLAGSPDNFDLPSLASGISSRQAPPDLAPQYSSEVPAPLPPNDDQTSAARSMQSVAQLHKICRQTFGNAEALVFDFIEESDPDHKQCILTITRPNGVSRSYSTQPTFSRKSDAKARAATVAVEMGAIDFILHGNKDATKSHASVALVPIDGQLDKMSSLEAKRHEKQSLDETIDESSKSILDCCGEWRDSRVQPHWLFYDEGKDCPTFGCALVVELTPYVQRVYSIAPTLDCRSSAQAACSKAALEQGVLDFIKYGNGQTAPAPNPANALEQIVVDKVSQSSGNKSRAGAMTLQTYLDSLPKPFPEAAVAEKSAAEINAPGILNSILQVAKGARFTANFYSTSDPKSRLHGCILRLQRPEELRTFVVLPSFAKRSDAKSAVCLRAFSQGAGHYIRSVASSVENRVTPEMRKMANEKILPILGSEYTRLRAGVHPGYEFDDDEGAFGCTLVLSLCEDPLPDQTRKWTVPPNYRTKADAKIAVLCQAGKDAIEFLRFRGKPAPPDYDPFVSFKKPRERDSRRTKTNTTPAHRNTSTDMARSVAMKREVSVESSIDKRHSVVNPPKRHHGIGVTSGMVKLGLASQGTAEGSSTSSKFRERRQTSRRGGRGYIVHGYQSSPRNRPTDYDVAAAATAVIERLTADADIASNHASPHIPRGGSWAPPSTNANPPSLHSGAYGPPPMAYAGAGSNAPPPLPLRQPYPALHMLSGQSSPPYPAVHPLHPPGTFSSYARQAGPRSGHTSRAVIGSSMGRGSTQSHGVNDRRQQKRARSPETVSNESDGSKKRKPTVPPGPKQQAAGGAASSTSDGNAIPNGPAKSSVDLLYEFCEAERMDNSKQPTFSHETAKKADGTEGYKIWAVMGTQRLELPIVFSSVNEGKQRLAKQVLQRLKSLPKG